MRATEFIATWLYGFSSVGFGKHIAGRLELQEVSILPKADEPRKQEGRVVLEIDVAEGAPRSSWPST